MNDNSWLGAFASLLGGLLLVGCEGATLCQRCEKPEETVRIEVDWQKLAAALKDAQVGRTTVAAESVNVTVAPGQTSASDDGQPPSDSKTVAVAGWSELVAALKSIQTAAHGSGCTDCPGNNATQSTHNIHHTTFAFRFAPPWFNADQRSLFTSYVVFPEEAKFEDWIDGEPAESCSREYAPASVCPDTAFYEKAMGPFLKGLSQCATTEKVQLHLVGFASATGLKPLEDESAKVLKQRYDNYVKSEAEHCEGKRVEDETDHSNMFNLLIANERAVNAAAMLENLMPTEPKNAFAIKAIPWCSHTAMANERDGEDGEGQGKGLMNRRVEVRLAVLPGCLNVDPDNRIDVTD